MRVSKQLGFIIASLLLVACAGDNPGGDDDVPDIDAAIPPGHADAAPADAALPVPDAEPGAPDAGPDAAPPPVSFATDIVPILMARCGGCHLKATGGSGGLSLGVQAELAYLAMVDQPTHNADPDCVSLKLVDTSSTDPSRSSFYLKIAGDTCGTRMPKGANPTPLPDAQLQLFARWIAAGAPNN